MRKVLLDIPKDVSDDEAKLLLAIKLFEENRVSVGRAAEIAGYSHRAFIEILSRRGVDVVTYPASELGEDLEHA